MIVPPEEFTPRKPTLAMSMIERVARKLAGQYMIDDGYGESSRASAEAGEMWKNFRRAAKVAIEAMREPTDGQRLEYLRLKKAAGHTDIGSVFLDADWERMIDAALKEPS